MLNILAVSAADDPLLATLLLPHSQNVLELVQRCLADDERSDTLTRTAYGLIGDLAECFSGGQLKQLFLSQWVANELRSRARMPEETRKTMRWAREVDFRLRFSFGPVTYTSFLDGQGGYPVDEPFSFPSHSIPFDSLF